MRLFQEHKIREAIDLNGVWLFATDPDGEGKIRLKTHGKTTVVPSCWNNETGLLEYEGAVWYEKEFFCNGGCLRFCFEGVMTSAEVFLDGEKLGEHYGGFCEFYLIKTQVSAGRHTLTLRVDNSFDAQSIPQKSVDWWHYGGITRSVRVETLKGLCVLYGRTDYTLQNGAAKIEQTVELYNAESDPIEDTLTLEIDGAVAKTCVCLAPYEQKTLVLPLSVEKVRLWDPCDPYLYAVSMQTSTDDLFDRTGFRTVEVQKDGVYINGKRRELRGVNRHEDHPEWGMAFPVKLMKRDLDIAIAAGVNAIRGSHYPNARAFLDYCDETGMLFWSEIPIWGCGFSVETLADPVVVARGLAMHEEMTRYYFNHPSIVVWGMHNEIRSDTEEGRAMSALYYRYLKEHGGNRIVTFASNHPFDDISFDYCDLVCINHYTGWYGGNIEAWQADVDRVRAYLQSLGFGDKPVIFSEFGAAAIYGHVTFDDVRWTEEYQARLFEHCLELFHRDPMVCGAFVWQFTDIRSKNGTDRSRGYNNKGIINECRKPKLAYFKVKECFLRFQREEENGNG